MCPECCWVHPGSYDSLSPALKAVGYIHGRWVHLKVHPGSLGLLVHALGVGSVVAVGFTSATWGSIGSSGDIGFVRALPGSR